MTRGYDIECVAAECEHLVAAIAQASRHPLPDWMAHRFAVLKSEASGLKREIENHKEEGK